MDGDVIGIIIAVGYVLFRYVVKAIGDDAEKEGRKTDVERTYENEPTVDVDKEEIHRRFRTRRDDPSFVDVDERKQRYVEPTTTSVPDARSCLLNQLLEGTRSTKSPSAQKKVRKLSHPEQSAKRSGTTHLQKMLHSSEGARRAFLMSEIFRRVY